MKPNELARLLSVAPNTLRQWAAVEFTEFLSPAAQGGNGLHRSFDDRDARILAWVALLKRQNTPLAVIVATLRTAQADDWRALPDIPGAFNQDDSVAMIPREAAEARLTALKEQFDLQVQALTRERDALAERLNRSEERLTRAEALNGDLQRKLAELTERILSLHEKEQRRRK